MSATDELYAPLIQAYKFFNRRLFDNNLPDVIFTLQRKKGVLGYFAAKRWGDIKGNFCNEIAINPAYFANSRMIEVMQTLVHEMAHCWQHAHGNPSDAHYHNKEWAQKMISIGLMPSSTGEPGGEITGRAMSDFIIKEGKFLSLVTEFIGSDGFQLSWVDRYSLPRLFEPIIAELKDSDVPIAIIDETSEFSNIRYLSETEKINNMTLEKPVSNIMPPEFFVPEIAKKQTRVRYVCTRCDTKVYGKINLNIRCDDCNNIFISDI